MDILGRDSASRGSEYARVPGAHHRRPRGHTGGTIRHAKVLDNTLTALGNGFAEIVSTPEVDRTARQGHVKAARTWHIVDGDRHCGRTAMG
jgi:hypothetical protein